MPPFIMLIGICAVVVLVMFGHNPLDRMRAEALKYGKDPLAREINKFNEERSKNGMMTSKYVPPPGATLYRLPPDQAQILPPRAYSAPGAEELVRPAPEVPMSEWGSPYPSYMLNPRQNFTNPPR